MYLVVMLGLATGFGWNVPIVQGEEPPGDERALPDGLELFLRARQFESEGNYREAADTYAEALEQAPNAAVRPTTQRWTTPWRVEEALTTWATRPVKSCMSRWPDVAIWISAV